MGRAIGFLGMLVSVMALTSLTYGAFQEPLGPYMQGIMGGVLDTYRIARDVLFSGLGWAFSGLINFLGQWFNWLPAAPWFLLPDLGKDFLTLYMLGAGALIRTAVDRSPFIGFLGSSIVGVVVWPVYILMGLLETLQDGYGWGFYGDMFKDWFEQVITIAACVVIFFLLVYAENQIGL